LLSKVEKNKKFIALPNGHGINRAQKRTLVTRADRQLLFAQKEHDSQARHFERRIENKMKPCERLDPSVSCSEGLHNHKGESIIDPRNQGSPVQLDDGDFDVDAQRTMLDSINKIHRSKFPVQLNSDDEILDQEKRTYRKNKASEKAKHYQEQTHLPGPVVANRAAEHVNSQRSAHLEKGDLDVGTNRTTNRIVPESDCALKSTHCSHCREHKKIDPGLSDSSSDSSLSDFLDSSDSETSGSSMDTRHASR